MIIRAIIVLTPIYVALFWAIVFLTGRYQANKPRFILGIFMAVVAMVYTTHAIFFLDLKELYLKLDSLYLFSGLSVYPLYYIYVRLLTCDPELRRVHLLHFLPAILLGTGLLITGILSKEADKMFYYQRVLIDYKWPGSAAPNMLKTLSAVYFSSRVVFGIQALVYLILGYQLTRKYDKRIANFYSNLEGRELVWVKLLTVTFLITTIVSTVANILGRGSFLENKWSLALPSLVFSSLFFIIGLQGSKQNFTVKVLEEDEGKDVDPPASRKSRSQLRSEKLKKELIKLLEEEKIYLNPELKITELCRLLNTNRTYLSVFINQEFKLSFNDLINRHRVKHAVLMLKTDTNNHFSLYDIAIASGFGSVSSFSRVFKKNTGVTVSHFKTHGSPQLFTGV
jgi:AraC-like DNA-binding protein